MPRNVSFEGKSYQFPDDATDDEVAAALDEAHPAPAAPSAAVDVAKSLPTGVGKAALGVAGFPGDVQEMSAGLADRAALAVGHKIMDWTGYGPQAGTPEREEFDRLYTGVGTGTGAANGGIPTSADLTKGVEAVAGPLHKPETGPGRYADTLGQFLPAALTGGGGLARRAAETVIPAVLSETAGHELQGSALEVPARMAGGLAGNLGIAGVAARADAPARAVVSAARGVTPQDIVAAQALAATGHRIGVPLSGPEAIQAATNNGTKLGDLQRAVEGSIDGGSILSRFYADRPGQVRTAAGQAFDQVAPQSAHPSTLGPRAATEATGALDDVRQGINRATRPDYDAAATHLLDPADFAPIQADPAFRASLARLRADEVLGPVYAQHPNNSIAVIDAVTKDMRDRGIALGNANNPGFSSQTAGMYGGGAAEARAIARDPARGGSQAYDDALTAQTQARRANLLPLEQGPLGNLSRATDTAAAGEAVLPSAGRAHVGGEGELATAVAHVVQRDPDLAAQLVRQRLADQFDRSSTRLVGGEAQGGGARFAKDIAGTDQQTANLDAVLDALNRPGAREAVGDAIDVFRATGTRKPQGSATDFNRQIRDTVGEMPLTAQALTAVKTGGASILTSAGDAAKRAWLGRNNATLADAFAAPDSVQRIAEMVRQGAATPFADALMRQAAQQQTGARQ